MSNQQTQLSELSALYNISVRDAIPEAEVSRVLAANPFISIPEALNLRTISSPTLKPNLLFRSGSLSHLSPAVLAPLKSTYGIRAIFDLRSKAEREKNPSPEIEGIETVWIPSTADFGPKILSKEEEEGAEKPKQVLEAAKVEDFIQNEGKEGYVKMYGNVLETHAGAYKAVFQRLRDGGGGVLFHCTAGKDRTGVLSALILALLDTPQEAIAQDYALTRIGVEPFRMYLLKLLLQQMGKETFEDALEEPGMEELCGMKGTNILFLLEYMNEKWGSEGAGSTYSGVVGYLTKELGFDEGDLEKIRSRLTADAAP
ncbi:uncharacterized protein PAC_19963 [Phialocephala subalpina]|uniref:Tyrosine specific protein phosphatases domain-containing protein n=1 Tax=Phialocephala subalpina TaxID=576137 RepID=A0A1L7XYA9_9HELO|nr:uncharacterized protein PAC_19963 [Phialocephala subalpina]